MSNLFETLSHHWRVALNPIEDKINSISTYLDSHPHIPGKEKIFASLPQSPSDIKVIILGQDPYPNPLHAMGLSCSVPSNVATLPASLKNIFKELQSDLGVINTNGDLTCWKDQGVLLLNTILTTNPNSPLSHGLIGWQVITHEIVKATLPNNPVAILWGNSALKLSTLFDPSQTIISSHPSPLSARHSFFGSKPFSRTNQILIASNKPPINWQTWE